jgi:hypothetical protein
MNKGHGTSANVWGMFVTGIILQTSPIPLTNIPLTLPFDRIEADGESCRK